MVAELVREWAPAKLNLCLHVTRQRADGYHLLDSLVAFAEVGDQVIVSPAPKLTLAVSGPEAHGLAGERDNLVLRAARTMGVAVTVELIKALPVASGIGGGSADAAATLRALGRLTGRPLPEQAAVLALGADVPVCLQGQTTRMRGIGESLSPVPDLPETWVVLVNPRQAVATPAVFAELTVRDNPAMPDPPVGGWASVTALALWLRSLTRNDLQEPALRIAPVIKEVLAGLEKTKGCLLARMSGSGATCFGLYADRISAKAAAEDLRNRAPGWWVSETSLQT